jgi:hypothetical protein
MTLEEYGQEVGVSFTLDELIQSHRRIRTDKMREQDELRKLRVMKDKVYEFLRPLLEL